MKKLVSTSLGIVLALSISTGAFAQDAPQVSEEIPAAALNSLIYYDTEPNNNITEANPYSVGNQITGSLGELINNDYYDVRDVYKFTAHKTEKVRFQLSAPKYGNSYVRMNLEGIDNDAHEKTTETRNYFDVDLVAGKEYELMLFPVNYSTSLPAFKYNVYSYVIE
ncbi:hypothetical protein [Aneurinibacillus migulanus]|uniref:Uncharacterized protein n=1 Tax=Aneurinibacillus migulanus TaxID=47500 RepID=A0A0D1W2V3_ANEMI|nr:hypothetical protein [Aneurinibacillus migulanus]KIV52750.1 hypothetical protein TS65_21630 [Aneurinibacillus migulanus]KON96106.1 hypothetical protein AF333_12050 [Aneurinibacillus migulanus]MED0896687.1 hypothetical protein [Aneurinibacillus migulanus]MED1617236.1 hypothetical protein [Aneurinibacillus migulanus]SDK43387.1 hypothetical protein SAMN04487909_15517 [Aneurinibacillus migulanus]